MSKPYNETGFSAKKPRDSLCESTLQYLKPIVEIETGQSFSTFRCVHYMSKPTYGTNYKIKVETDTSYLHLHLYTPPQGAPQINHIERDRSLEDDLALPFDLRRIHVTDSCGGLFSFFR